MATSTGILTDAFDRVADGVRDLLAQMTAADLAARPDGVGNSIGWLVWHLSRVQDDHLAEIAGREQVWTSGGWMERLGLPFPAEATGYGFDDAEVVATRIADPAVLAGYHAAVHELSTELLVEMPDSRFDDIIDERWDPPVTVAVRLVSVVEDCFQHLGQANYVAGLLRSRT